VTLEELADSFLRYRAPYAATLGIAATCAYLGLFCVYRRIVFTGAALAQLAAAGSAAGLFLAPRVGLGLEPLVERYAPTLLSLLASLGGALVLRARRLDARVTPDAVVGLVHSGAAGLAVLLVWRSAHGPAELANLLAGEVLLARPGELLVLALGLVGVGAIHAVYRARFLLVSFDPDFARASGLPEARLQALFLGSLAVAVALVLQVAGLLLTFAFLVLAPVAGLQLGRRAGDVALVAAAAAVVASFAGFLAAIAWDLPVAPTIATALLGVAGAAWAAGRQLAAARAARAGLLGLAALSLAALAPGWLWSPAPPRAAPAPPSPVAPVEARQVDAAAQLAALTGAHEAAARAAAAVALGEARPLPDEALDGLLAAQLDEEAEVRAAATRALAGTDLAARLHGRQATGPSCAVRTYAALALAGEGDREGLAGLVDALGDPDLPALLRAEALDRLTPLRGPGPEPVLDPFSPSPEAVAAWHGWWSREGPRLVWDPTGRRWTSPGPR
jgi:zinc/manganese transport system permease protein